MNPVGHMRFHGRGGEGVKLSARMTSRALFLSGYEVQDSPLYGAERRGAPVVAFVRFAREPILERGYVTHPDVLIVLDDTLLDSPEAGVWEGVAESQPLVLVNTPRDASELRARYPAGERVACLDVTSLCLDVLGRAVLSAPIAALTLKATGLASWEVVEEAIASELRAEKDDSRWIERNLTAAHRVFEATPTAGWRPGPASPAPAAGGHAGFEFPLLAGELASPSVWRPGTSALRSTSGWRVFRPIIERARCTRCFLCFVLCPEGAIALDEQHFPVVDELHCKGCLVCVEECPTGAIRAEREVHA